MSEIERTALYFGPEERSLFGWLHAPPGLAAAPFGVILCNPLGYEYICAHRTVRAYADAIAQAGFPALRFDYDGSGDSAGSDEDPDRVAAWTHSIELAALELQRTTGADRFVLFGIRAGALLAVAASRRIPGVKAIAMHAPVPSARAYLRELRALRAAMGQAGDTGTASLETAGFSYSPQTQETLARLDYDLPVHVEDLLLIDRDDFPSSEALLERFRSGRRMQHSTMPGYTAMMSDPHNVVVPRQAIERLIDWLLALAPNSLPATACRRTATRATVTLPFAGGAVIEHFLQTGSGGQGFGIVTHPERGSTSSRVVVLLNAGSVHHVGPSQLYVQLAREWAQRGLTVIRFDLPGIGDSDPHAGARPNVPYPDTAVADIQSLSTQLPAKINLEHTMLVGLCSGAYHALKTGLEASAGAVILINPLTFYYSSEQSLDYPDHRVLDDVNRYRRSILQPQAWRKLITGQVDVPRLMTVLLKQAGAQLDSRRRDLARALGIKVHQDLGSDLNAIANRGTRLHFIFSRGDPGLDLLKMQGGAAVEQLVGSHRLSVDVIEGGDHTFTARAPRTLLQDLLTELVLSDRTSPAH